MPSYSLDLREQALRLRDERGWGYWRVGKALGVPPGTVQGWFYGAGVKRMWTPEEDQYLRDGWPYGQKEELLKQLGRSWNAISFRAWSLGAHRRKGWPLSLACKLKRLSHFTDNGDWQVVNRPFYDWLVGFIEGEGSWHISRGKQNYLAYMTIAQKESGVLHKIQAELQKDGIDATVRNQGIRKNSFGSELWELRIHRRRACLRLCQALVLRTWFSTLKKEQFNRWHRGISVLVRGEHYTEEGRSLLAGVIRQLHVRTR